MFEPEKEVPSLELCGRLKKLGYPQESGGWYWVVYDKEVDLGLLYPDVPSHRNSKDWLKDCFDIIREIGGKEIVKAPTVRELGEWLPDAIKAKIKDFSEKQWFSLFIFNYEEGKEKETKWECCYSYIESFGSHWHDIVSVRDSKLADALAKMLIWLVENGYVKFESENKEEDQKNVV